MKRAPGSVRDRSGGDGRTPKKRSASGRQGSRTPGGRSSSGVVAEQDKGRKSSATAWSSPTAAAKAKSIAGKAASTLTASLKKTIGRSGGGPSGGPFGRKGSRRGESSGSGTSSASSATSRAVTGGRALASAFAFYDEDEAADEGATNFHPGRGTRPRPELNLSLDLLDDEVDFEDDSCSESDDEPPFKPDWIKILEALASWLSLLFLIYINQETLKINRKQMAAPIANDLVDRVFGKSLDNLDLLEDLFVEVKKEAAFGLGGFGGIGVVLREMEKEEQEAKLRAEIEVDENERQERRTRSGGEDVEVSPKQAPAGGDASGSGGGGRDQNSAENLPAYLSLAGFAAEEAAESVSVESRREDRLGNNDFSEPRSNTRRRNSKVATSAGTTRTAAAKAVLTSAAVSNLYAVRYLELRLTKHPRGVELHHARRSLSQLLVQIELYFRFHLLPEGYKTQLPPKEFLERFLQLVEPLDAYHRLLDKRPLNSVFAWIKREYQFYEHDEEEQLGLHDAGTGGGRGDGEEKENEIKNLWQKYRLPRTYEEAIDRVKDLKPALLPSLPFY